MEKQEYLLRNKDVVLVQDGSKITIEDIECCVMSFYGFVKEKNDETGLEFWIDEETRNPIYIVPHKEDGTELDEMTLQEVIRETGCSPLVLMSDLSIAHDLVKELSIHVSAVTYRDGSLAGIWRAERLSVYRPYDTEIHGIIHGANQPVATESLNMLYAIYATACRIMGVGKRVYIHFPNGADADYVLLSCDDELRWQLDGHIGKDVFEAPALTRFITCGELPPHIEEQAVEEARNSCRSALVSQETSED